MSMIDGRIKVSHSMAFPYAAFEAVTASYEPGDPIGYGRTPEAAVHDLINLIHLHLSWLEIVNPQSGPT